MYLNCHSYYSLRYGTFSEKELLELGQKHGQKVLALTDINNTSACMSFVRQAADFDIKPIIGIDFRCGAKQLFVGLAKNNKGFHELNSYLSFYTHSKQPIPEEAPQFTSVKIIYPLSQVISLAKENFSSNEYIGIAISDIPLLHRSPYFKFQKKMVLLNQVTFRHKRDFNVHRLLRAIDNNTLLSKLPKTEEGQASDTFLNAETLDNIAEQYPLIIKNTETLQNECSIHFDFKPKRQHQNLLSFFGDRNGDYKFIEILCQKGLKKRYDEITPIITNRIKKELETIKEMDYVAFFLVNWKIIQYAKSKGYYHVGRGSGANSIVAYLLGITDVDPIHLDLYFERFMNIHRANPPDFDIDFSSKDRNDITNFIFEYFKGHGQVALLATYNCFKHSGAVRELGKVFGLPKAELDILSDGKFDINKLDSLQSLVVKYSQLLIGIPNHLSVHSSGIIISEKPIHYFSATNLPPKGFPTVQFDMEISEDVGLFKYDILGQRGLGKIKDTLSIIRKNRPELPPIDIHDVKRFMEDPVINKNISDAKCIGCFYVESPAMRMLLKKLGVNTYLGLVAASSIIRPGVAKSGMMREYILRHRDSERAKQGHPVMLEIMPETYGVMVYQEDVIKVAHYFADLNLIEADQLRRGMSGKFRSREEFVKVKQKFITNCRLKGIPEETIKDVWNQTESFAGYAFAKGHSASYAIESYQSLFLKTYYPLEYMVAVLNNGGGFYRTETYIHEARLHGGVIHSPNINLSNIETTIIGQDIFLGLAHLHNLDTDLVATILHEREKNGPYTNLENFLDRIDTKTEQIQILLRIGAFNFTGINRRELLWTALYRLNTEHKKTHQNELFKIKSKAVSLPKLTSTELEDVFDQMEILGYPLCNPFLLVEQTEKTQHYSLDMPDFINKQLTLYGYLVTYKRTSTSKGTSMFFGTFLDKHGQWIDTVHFPPVAARYPFRGRGVYKLVGKVVSEFDFLSLEITQMQRINYIPDPRYT
ncbi:DNA polymerase III subunit alpha [Arcticibacterium luteifluviistationis]|uniref:DNA-directed DNA polymerase n=1 Tax=Arcticibacterium luteifluviistationis TaxID=1784714 RepID=A0A2Z4G960_9BACT|nr:DNA polymerase III subunit alpha [Arcticibacterium luteifluviistationis]AWV97706.1 DNA polymerase III subunit alpha [Arcticibacterium luteifluviistationis]